MSVSAWVFARQSRFPTVQNARFSYGYCTPTLEPGLAPKCSQLCGHFAQIRACFSFEPTPFPPSRQNPESLYTPNDAKLGRNKRRPCETPHRCGPLREVLSGAFLVHTIRRRRRTRRPPRPRRSERHEPDTQLPARPVGPSAAGRAPLPSSRRRVQKCTFHVGALHVGPVLPTYKNARFS